MLIRRDFEPAPATAGCVMPVPVRSLIPFTLLDRFFLEKIFGRFGLSSRLDGRDIKAGGPSSNDDVGDTGNGGECTWMADVCLREKNPRLFGGELEGSINPSPFLLEEELTLRIIVCIRSDACLLNLPRPIPDGDSLLTIPLPIPVGVLVPVVVGVDDMGVSGVCLRLGVAGVMMSGGIRSE